MFESHHENGTLASESSLQQKFEFKFFQINFCKIEDSAHLETEPNHDSEDSEEQELNVDLENASVVLQITDISGKLLYTEAKAQTRYVTMMQASVSHEMRNPTASIIYQLNNVRDDIQQLFKVCTMMQIILVKFAASLPEEVLKRLQTIYDMMTTSVNGVRESGRRLVGLSQLIDFFVHDMLDFGVLSEKAENFTRTLEAFDLHLALNEI